MEELWHGRAPSHWTPIPLMCLLVRDAFGAGPASGWSSTGHAGSTGFQEMKVRRNIRMLSHSKGRLARVLAMLSLAMAALCSLATIASAQEQPAPKWELFGGYSIFDPGANVHGLLPGASLPISSRMEWNPRGAGASVTYNFNNWFGLSLDTSTHWGSRET